MTVLTMTFLAMDSRGDLPKVSYSTALDYFVGTCFAFVLATIIQVGGATRHLFSLKEINHDGCRAGELLALILFVIGANPDLPQFTLTPR